MIDNIDGFISSLFSVNKMNSVGGGGGTWYRGDQRKEHDSSMYCPKCGDERRMYVDLHYSPDYDFESNTLKSVVEKEEKLCVEEIKERLSLSLWTFKCKQCNTIFTVVFYQSPNGLQLAILPSCSGGVVTANTSTSVAYYLDQAYRAKSVGANSACIAMYRGALDQLMHQQGYKEGMLGAKLAKLEKDINSATAQKWAMDLDIKFLRCLNALGSGSIHPNDGDVEKQKELDNELIEIVDVVFGMLLDKIYEQPKREENWKNALEDKSKLFAWKK